MSHRAWAPGLVCLCSLVVCAPVVTAQEQKPTEQPKKAEPQKKTEEARQPPAAATSQPAMEPALAEKMKKMMEFATRGEAHKRLEPLAGRWEYAARWWLSPDAQPQSSKGTCQNHWLLDGRYLHQVVTGAPTETGEPPLRGFGVLGYDNLRKQYFGMWIDNLGTGIRLGYGTADPSGKIITMSGEASDPMSGEINHKWRSVTRIASDDQYVFEIFGPAPDGKEFRQMEIIYTRAK